MKRQWAKARWRENSESTKKVIRSIFEKNSTQGDLKVLLAGTAFQIKVWEALLRIPVGLVQSYQDVAKTIKKPRASRAVGTAVGQNSIAYLIPCHRVIRETGVVGGYRWGSLRKKAILGWEESKRF
jgi:AraC family transcriptional regulator of adaptative response/methylated-DNA-[protein]-cysteine methyltransferase